MCFCICIASTCQCGLVNHIYSYHLVFQFKGKTMIADSNVWPNCSVMEGGSLLHSDINNVSFDFGAPAIVQIIERRKNKVSGGPNAIRWYTDQPVLNFRLGKDKAVSQHHHENWSISLGIEIQRVRSNRNGGWENEMKRFAVVWETEIVRLSFLLGGEFSRAWMWKN